jgi:L-alanine-DL-glutamate epimerase-like enolase superfamily enzyme
MGEHGPGWAIWKAISGVDMALWDARGKALGLPVWRLLGGTKKRIRAYAGGICLGYQAPESLAEEALGYVRQGFTAVKLRLGDTIANDTARVQKVREVLGSGVDIMVDINTYCPISYSTAGLAASIPGTPAPDQAGAASARVSARRAA